MKNLWLLLASTLFLISCSENTSGMRYENGSHYVSCILKAGAYIDGEQTVKLGKTIDIENAQWDMLPDSTASITVKEFYPDSTAGMEVNLSWNGEMRGYIDENGAMQIIEEHRYVMDITTIDGHILRAETTVPKAIEVLGDSEISLNPAWAFEVVDDNWQELELETADSEHPVQISTQDDEEFNLYTEVWHLEKWEDAEYTYLEDGHEYPDDNEEYMGTTQQYPRRNIGYYMYQPENGILNFNSYQGSLMFYGRVVMKVYAIDDNYLSYLYRADGYEYGGIEGGIGVFGSSCGDELYTKVVKSLSTKL